MELANLIWFLALVLLLLVINILIDAIIRSLEEKPLGQQSEFDAAISDTCRIMVMVCLVAITGTLETCRNFLTENRILLSVFCVMYGFSLISLCDNAGCVCLVRIVCIGRMIFIDETIGESKVRILLLTATMLAGSGYNLAFVLVDDVTSGTAVTLLTAQLKVSGSSMLNRSFHCRNNLES